MLIAIAIPLGLALTFGSGRRWAIPTAILAVGVMSAASRTPILVLTAAGLVLLWLQPRDIKRLLPLAVPLLIVVKLALPGSIATLKSAFFPEGGLVAQQSAFSREADPLLAGGRVRSSDQCWTKQVARPCLVRGSRPARPGFSTHSGTHRSSTING